MAKPVKLTKGQAKEILIGELTKGVDAHRKWAVKAIKATPSRNSGWLTRRTNAAIRGVDNIQGGFNKLVTEGAHPDTSQLDQMVSDFGQIITTNFPKDKTNLRPDEVKIAILLGELVGYEVDNVPAYMGGDQKLEGEESLDIQIKGHSDVFRIHYNLDIIKREMSKNGKFDPTFISSMQNYVADLVVYERSFLESVEGKVAFMEKYSNISGANWYLLALPNAASWTMIGFPAHLMTHFVRSFPNAFRPTAEGTAAGKRTGQSKMKLTLGNSNSLMYIWEGIINANSVLHYRDESAFYKDRKKMLGGTRESYNAVFHGANAAGNIQLQNSLFAPIKY